MVYRVDWTNFKCNEYRLIVLELQHIENSITFMACFDVAKYIGVDIKFKLHYFTFNFKHYDIMQGQTVVAQDVQ